MWVFISLLLGMATSLHAKDEQGTVASELMVDRRGAGHQDFMLTEKIIQWLSPGQLYQIGFQGLVDTGKRGCVAMSEVVQRPLSLEIVAKWNKQESVNRADASILGGFGSLVVKDDQSVVIPVVMAMAQNLAYYGASLISVGGVVSFEADASLPLATMEIGSGYAQNFLMHPELGGGFYLETHDRPHFHMPLHPDSGGYLILGKSHGNDLIELTAFQIPFGLSVYTPPDVIHSDGFLVGRYMVVYSVTSHYSTVLLQQENGVPLMDVSFL